jgi:peptidoglycan L-alanyl-D-glutamate endopeptidase CwlK
MGPYRWSQRSRDRLASCHPLLIALFDRVLARDDLPHDLTVICGHRTQAAQDRAWAENKSQKRWPNSKHNSLPSMAVDVAPYRYGQVSWERPDYHDIAPIVQDEWARMEREGLAEGYRLTWGGDWRTLRDFLHWQIDVI